MNGFAKVCLVIIILLLAVIAIRPISGAQTAFAASEHYQYRVVAISNAFPAQIQPELDKNAAEGWELATGGYSETTHGVPGFTLIFSKRVR
jgi:hypothetical protein